MTKLRQWFAWTVFAAMLIAAPVFACEKCETVEVPDQFVMVECQELTEEGWGSDSCKIRCFRFGTGMMCQCDDSENGCYSIVVNG